MRTYIPIYLYYHKNKLADSIYVTLSVCEGMNVVDTQGLAPAAIVELCKGHVEKQLQWYGNHYTVRELGDRLCGLYQLG